MEVAVEARFFGTVHIASSIEFILLIFDRPLLTNC